MVEYALDTDQMQALITWEFPGGFTVDPWYRDEWHTSVFGDADRLSNGNTLINAGTVTEGQESRIFEVTPDGEVVWEFTFPCDEDSTTGSYRADRVSVPLVESIGQ